MGATIFDFRDTDLMAKIAEQGADGVTSTDLSTELGLSNGDEHAVIAPRLSWMRSFGMLSYDEKRKLWRVSEGGERVIEARERAAAAKAIEAVPDEAMVEVMANVMTRYRLGDSLNAHLLRREFQYGTGRRR